jgi:hypothetical protein
MDDPIALFLTWNTYGTWLPGDSRGWIEYGRGWRLPLPWPELESAARMTDDACRLTREMRAAVEGQLEQTCRIREWPLLARNCRSNHVHVAVAAQESSLDVESLDDSLPAGRFRSGTRAWWAERGSIRWIFDETSLEAAIIYVRDGQDKVRRES